MPDALGRHLHRDQALVCAVMVMASLLAWPQAWRIAAGVLGGGVLIGASAWAIRGLVDGLLDPGEGRRATGRLLVKFFTRHAILAVAAYGMMVRLHLDPVGMLVGVSSLALAAGVEAIRRLQQVP